MLSIEASQNDRAAKLAISGENSGGFTLGKVDS